MKVTGGATLHAPTRRVWAALSDPAVLARTIPGCERLVVSGPGSCKVTVTAGIASTRGTYAGEVSLSDRQEPTSFQLRASGAGGPGTVSTNVHVRLTDGGNGNTVLSYDADAVIGGMIAGVGQRMLTSVAQRLASEFFTSVNGVLAGEPGTMGTATQEHGEPTPADPGVCVVPPRPKAPASGQFLRGVLTGAAIALAGVIVRGLVARRNR